MGMSVNFNWRGMNLSAGNADPNGIGSGLASVGNAIGAIRRGRYEREQRERTNAIEDEERRRRYESEDERRRYNRTNADNVRAKIAERAELVRARDNIIARIDEIKKKVGL